MSTAANSKQGTRTGSSVSRGLRRVLRVTACALAVATLGWLVRHSILTGAAVLLVEEDPVTETDTMVVSNSAPQAAALEVALLYRQHTRTRIVMATWADNPLLGSIRGLVSRT